MIDSFQRLTPLNEKHPQPADALSIGVLRLTLEYRSTRVVVSLSLVDMSLIYDGASPFRKILSVLWSGNSLTVGNPRARMIGRADVS